MSTAISFKELSYGDFFDNLSFEIETGSSVMLVTARDDKCDAIIKLILGMYLPSKGSVKVANQTIGEISSSQLYQLRQTIGVVPSNGGMISNLKLLENITLPTLYTTGSVTQENEDLAISLLKKLKYNGGVMALPAHLTLYEKRIAAFVRAVLCQPKIMLYNCFEGISSAYSQRLTVAMKEFHEESPERTSLYIVSSVDSTLDISVDYIINLQQTIDLTIAPS